MSPPCSHAVARSDPVVTPIHERSTGISPPLPALTHAEAKIFPLSLVYLAAFFVCSLLVLGTVVAASAPPLIQTPPKEIAHRSAFPGHVSDSSLRYPGWIGLGAYWDFHDSVIVVQGYLPTAKAYYGKKSFRDFTFEVRMAKLSEDGAIGLLFRYDEVRDEGYEIHFWPHGGFAVAKFVGPTKTDFASGAPSHFNRELNTWNLVRVEGRGERFDFFINGFHVHTAFDGKYRRGRLGLLMPGDARQRAKFQVIRMSE